MNRKKIFIEILIFILITALAAIGYNVTAAITTEMASKGIGYPSGYPTITLSDLINNYNLLCSEEGRALPGSSATTVVSGKRSKDIPYPSYGQVAFTTGETKSSRNPFSYAESETLSRYKTSGPVTAVPEEAYILSEMTENTNGNTGVFYNVTDVRYEGEIIDSYAIPVRDESDYIYGVDLDSNGEPTAYVVKEESDYYYVDINQVGSDYFPYTYVQQAWWSSPAGSTGNPVTQNDFSVEAKEFDKYIKSVRKGTDTVDKTVTVNGTTVTVPAPIIDYQVTSTMNNATVNYNEETRKYLIGPFTLNFPEWVTTSTDRGEVRFAGISNMDLKGIQVNGSSSQEITIDHSNWDIQYSNVREESGALSEYPHDGEEFYIVLDYIEGVTKISDIKVDFKYMNAGATYENLTGKYNIVSWTPKTEVVSDGEWPIYIHTLECTAIDSKTSQKLALGVEAARWYEHADYSLFNGDLVVKDEPIPTPTPVITPNPITPTPGRTIPPYTADDDDDDDYSRKKKKVIELTIPIEGEVWIDTKQDKANGNVTEGKRDDGEKGYKNAEVYVYKVYKNNGTEVKRELAKIYEKDNDKELSFPIYTDENGKYTIPKILVPGTEDKNNKYDIEYDVVFKFDGQTYTASNPLPTANGDAKTYINASRAEKDSKYASDSLASENATERDTYNKKFETITGDKAMDDSGNTEGKAGNLKLDYTSEAVTYKDNTKRRSKLTTLDSNGHIIEQYKMIASTANTGIYVPVNHEITKDNADSVTSTVDKHGNKTTTTYHTIYNYMKHINLAVKEREESDLGVLKDLYKAKIVVNEKEITKKFNTLVDFEDAKYAEFLNIQLENAQTKSYKLGLYNSDYEYRSTVYEKEVDQVKAVKTGETGSLTDTNLRVFLTYKIAVFNEGSYDMVINDLNDYYDKTFTLVTEEQKANIVDGDTRTAKVVAEPSYYRVIGSTESPKYDYTSNGMTRFDWASSEATANDSYKKGNITSFSGLKLHPGEQLQLFVTYEVDKGGAEPENPTRNLLGEKNNVAEIASYSIYNLDGSVAGRIDRDSAPNNIKLDKVTDKAWYEDDTESAPAIKIELTDFVNREINGVVWEDKETNTIKFDQKVANGYLDDDETRIPDVDVELVEKITVDGKEYEHIWKNEDIKNFKDVNPENYELDVTTNDDGEYTFKGVLAGNYVVRFKYGNKDSLAKYNGQDYKNTAYEAGLTDLNQEWQDIKSDAEVNNRDRRVSDARDYEPQRMRVIAYSKTIDNKLGTVLESADKDVNHDELIKNTQMVANTAKLNLEIEHPDYIESNKLTDGTVERKYVVNGIDFGLEQRSETAIELSKNISKITLMKNDGIDTIMEVIINEDGSIDFEKSIQGDKLINIAQVGNTQGIRFANIEKSYLNNMSISLEYTIKAKNTSEVDWTGDIADLATSEISAKADELADTYDIPGGVTYGRYVGNNYYTNTNNNSDRIVKTNVNQIIDYIDNDIGMDVKANQNVENHAWKNVKADELRRVLADSVYNTEGKIVDNKGISFEGNGKSNIVVTEDGNYNPDVVAELVPTSAASEGKTTGRIKITTSKTTSSDADSSDLNFNNMVEILSYSNTVGRRDMNAVPGNAEISRGAYEAATGYKNNTLIADYEGAKEINGQHLNGERDTAAADLLTFTEPTGLDVQEETTTNYMVAILSASIVIAAGIMVTMLFVFKRK